MKPLLTFIGLMFAWHLTPGALPARDLFLKTGVKLSGIEIIARDTVKLRILHDTGISDIDFADLTEADKRELQTVQMHAIAVSSPALAAQQAPTRNYEDRDYANRDYSQRTYTSQTASSALGLGGSVSPRNTSSNWWEENRPRVKPRYNEEHSSYSGGGTVHVKGYFRKDGTYVRPHTRRRR